MFVYIYNIYAVYIIYIILISRFLIFCTCTLPSTPLSLCLLSSILLTYCYIKFYIIFEKAVPHSIVSMCCSLFSPKYHAWHLACFQFLLFWWMMVHSCTIFNVPMCVVFSSRQTQMRNCCHANTHPSSYRISPSSLQSVPVYTATNSEWNNPSVRLLGNS